MPNDAPFEALFEAARSQVPPAAPAPFDPRKAQPYILRDPREWSGAPPARRWIVRDWIPRGTVTALYGDGGVGKSLLAQQLLTSTALSLPWLGMETSGGRALGIMCEDDDDELHRRQTAINASLGVEMAHLENLRLVSRVGENNVVMTFAQRTGIGELTEAFYRIDRTCAQLRPALVVGDTIADFFGGSEIDRGHVRQFVQNAWGNIARKHDCAVLLCGHPSASGINTGSGTGGSTAWSNTVRSRLYLSRPPAKDGEEPDPDARMLARMKANYAPRQAEVNLRYIDGVLMERDAAGGGRPTLEWPEIDKIFTEIASAWHAGKPWSLAAQTKRDGRYLPLWAEMHLGVSSKAVARHCEQWLAGGYLAVDVLDAKAKVKGLRVVRHLHQGA
jgi:RecA-family ATPase